MPARRPGRLADALRPLRADRSPLSRDVRRAPRGTGRRLPGSIRRRLPEPGAFSRRGPAVDLDLPDRGPLGVARLAPPARPDAAVERAAARAAAPALTGR